MGTRDVMNTASESSMQKCCFKVTSLPTLTQFSYHKKSLLGISFVNFKSKSSFYNTFYFELNVRIHFGVIKRNITCTVPVCVRTEYERNYVVL